MKYGMKIIFTVMIVLALLGCDLIDIGDGTTDDSPEEQEERGSLTVSLSDEINSRTLEPAISMDAASFTIEGEGPDDEIFTPVVIDDPETTSYEIDDLLAGVWTITVTAYNEDDAVIGEGIKTTSITAGDNTISIDVLPLPGDGEFELTISWPDGTITDPGFDASLTRIGDDTQSITIPDLSDASQVVYTDTEIAAGYYTLNIIPKTGEDDIEGTGFTEVVRIVEGEKTPVLFELTPSGDTEITWETNLMGPYFIDIERTPETWEFIASVNPDADDYLYSWYLNGVELQDISTSTVTLSEEDLVSGSNTLNAVVSKDGVASSARKIIEFPSQFLTPYKAVSFSDVSLVGDRTDLLCDNDSLVPMVLMSVMESMEKSVSAIEGFMGGEGETRSISAMIRLQVEDEVVGLGDSTFSVDHLDLELAAGIDSFSDLLTNVISEATESTGDTNPLMDIVLGGRVGISTFISMMSTAGNFEDEPFDFAESLYLVLDVEDFEMAEDADDDGFPEITGTLNAEMNFSAATNLLQDLDSGDNYRIPSIMQVEMRPLERSVADVVGEINSQMEAEGGFEALMVSEEAFLCFCNNLWGTKNETGFITLSVEMETDGDPLQDELVDFEILEFVGSMMEQ